MKGKVEYINSSSRQDLARGSTVYLPAYRKYALVVDRHRGGPGYLKGEVVFWEGDHLVNVTITFENVIESYDTLSPSEEEKVRGRWCDHLDLLKKKGSD